MSLPGVWACVLAQGSPRADLPRAPHIQTPRWTCSSETGKITVQRTRNECFQSQKARPQVGARLTLVPPSAPCTNVPFEGLGQSVTTVGWSLGFTAVPPGFRPGLGKSLLQRDSWEKSV